MQLMYDSMSKYQLALTLLLPVLFGMVLIAGGNTTSLWRLLCFGGLYWLPVVTAAFFWKMPPRVLVPSMITYIIVLTILASILIGPKNRRFSWSETTSPAIVASAWVLVLALGFAAWHRKSPEIKVIAHEIEENAKLTRTLNTEFRNELVVFTMDSLNDFVKYQPLLSSPPMHGTYMTIDASWVALYPEYTEHLRNRAGSELLPAVFDSLHEKNNRVVFVSTPARIKFLKEYLATVYERNYEFDSIEPSTLDQNWKGAHFYRMR